MAIGSVLPWYGGTFDDDNGNPISFGKVFFYLTGSSTKTDTWSDANLSSLNTNPVVLDAAGRANVFLGPAVYKVVIATSTSADPPVGADIIKTIDGIASSVKLSGVISINTTAVGNVGAGEDMLMHYSINPGWFIANVGVRITAWGTTAANATAKQIKLQTISSPLGVPTKNVIVASTSSVDYNNLAWKIVAEIVGTGVADQENIGLWTCPGAATATIRSILTRSATSANFNDTTGGSIFCTGEAGADNDIVQRGMIIEVLNGLYS